MKVRVSVVMATYNGAEFIKTQIDSILAQTIQDFEVVVCDDCSSDSTWQILTEFAAKDARFRLYRNDCNIGFKKNFEKGILMSQGDYIALCDQDDIWARDHLAVLIDNIGDNMISAGDAETIDSDGKPTGFLVSERYELNPFPQNNLRRALIYLLVSNQVQGNSMLISREFFALALPIADRVFFHDAWFSLLSCFYGGMSYSRQIVTYHRRHKHNTSKLTTKKITAEEDFFINCKYDNSFDRIEMLNEISYRVKGLNLNEKVFIFIMKIMLRMNKKPAGRIVTSIIKLPLFRVIYGKPLMRIINYSWESISIRIKTRVISLLNRSKEINV